MVRNGCAGIREGDLFHGRYRVLRSIENDRTGALYEALDVTSDAHRILKVVQAETLAGTGVQVRLKSDACAWENGNIAYLSDAGLDQDTRSFFFIMELAEDTELEPVTKQRVVHCGESNWSENTHRPLRSNPPSATDSSGFPVVQRVSVPVPLPPPLPPAGVRVAPLALPPPPAWVADSGAASDAPAVVSARSGSLPAPVMPPEKPSSGQLSLRPRFTSKTMQVLILLAVAIGTGMAVYFYAGRMARERLPPTTIPTVTNSLPNTTPTSTTSVESTAQELPEPSVPTNWALTETHSNGAAGVPADIASSNEMAPKTAPLKTITSPSTTKKPHNGDSAAPVQTNRPRESIF